MIRRRKRSHRAGTATVELAVCLPLVVLVTFGGVEGASLLFTKQALVTSAYEGIKVAVDKDSTEEEVLEAARAVLSDRVVDRATITIDPASFQDLDQGDFITVTVSAPGDVNSVFPFGPFQGRDVAVQATMAKE